MIKPALLCVLALTAPVLDAAGARGGKGVRYPAEQKTFLAEESGWEVIQVTTDPADDSGLYFTSHSFVPEDHGLVFTSRRTGAWNLYYLDLRTFAFVQLTDGKAIAGTGADVCAATREVFYRDGNLVKAVSLTTLKERTITTVPEGYSVGAAVSVTDAGDTVAFSISEKIHVATKTDVIYSDMNERFTKRPWSAVMIGRADGTGWHERARQKKWISHVIMSPTNPDLTLYCHEGRWDQVEQRMWLVSAAGNRPLRPEETPALSIGHEYWFPDGIHVGYQATYPKKAKMIGVADTRDGSYREYPTEFFDGHTQVSHDGRWFVGDGKESAPYLNLYHLVEGKLTGRHVFRHGSLFSQQHWHPHPAFSPDDRYVLFTSSRAGNGDVYLLRVKK
ncbi:oligogalacturonate lyase family protein [Opitutus sp. ER46]|uniref:oligogalacturonate lyase family protein n=1 Tax=Opitutus sp. ER46 TaxID=2161864 RepID=UPI000D2FA30C|nr:oligogalacturonate lyase family protein [Opitutus sp. ER46]PTX98990.1 hypothetical protein DB354_02930 [Opitutus sp. ER46]